MKTDRRSLMYLLAAVVVCVVIGGYNVFIDREDKNENAELSAVQSELDYGLVTGVVYSTDNPIAVIDEEIVHEGDIVHGVKIVRIYKNSVEFEKAGQHWIQDVNEPPAQQWLE